MKFIYAENAEKAPTFGDVQTNQFFVTTDGKLCQKIGRSSYNVIALKDGAPFAAFCESCCGFKIKRILPKVAKIEF